MKIDNQVMEDAHVLMHPTRYRIAELLSEKSMNIHELSEALGKEERLVFYHLSILEEHGFVNGNFKTLQEANFKEIATKRYGMTKKGCFSYNLIILDTERIGTNEKDLFKHPELKRKLVREYSATEKVDAVLSKLKGRYNTFSTETRSHFLQKKTADEPSKNRRLIRTEKKMCPFTY
jgi:DNA-binding transcriptional ArsR family regulator